MTPGAAGTSQVAAEERPPRSPQLRLFKMKKQRRKELWQFVKLSARPFHQDVPDHKLKNRHAEFAFCLHCKTSIPFRIGQHKVLEHMQMYHMHEMAEYLARQGRIAGLGFVDEQTIQRNLGEEFDAVTEKRNKRSVRTATAEEQKRINRLITKWIARHFRPMLLVEDPGFIELVRFLTEEIGRVKITIPKRTQLRGDIRVHAAELRSTIREMIARDCSFYSITSDIWTARNTKSYVSFTLHYVDKAFNSMNWTLEVEELPGIHDSTAIASALHSIMQRWSLPKDLCTKFVRDAGSNMTAAAASLRVPHMSCIAHALHLVVAGALIKPKQKRRKRKSTGLAESHTAGGDCVVDIDEEDNLSDTDENDSVELVDNSTDNSDVDDDILDEGERAELANLRAIAEDELDSYLDLVLDDMQLDEMGEVRKVVQRFRSLTGYFRKSPKARHRLGEIQVEMGVARADILAIKIDCSTRWNSCWDMLQRFIRLEDALTQFFVHLTTTEGKREFKDTWRKLTTSRPVAKDWLVIKCLRTLLAPFAVATATLSGQVYPTAPLVMPALSGIKVHLQQRRMFNREFAAAGAESYVARTEVMMSECRNTIKMLFEQRFAHLENSELMWVAYLDPRIAKRMAHLNPADIPQACADIVDEMIELAKVTEAPPTNSVPTATFLSPVPTPFAAESFMNDHMFGPDICNTAVIDLRRCCEDEFKRYLSDAAVVMRDDDPFAWWSGNRQKFPNLSRVARKWLGAVATSVPSERAFSASGNIVTAKRSSLTADMVKDLVFISDNRQMSALCIC